MTENIKIFAIKFLFDPEQITREKLISYIQGILSEHLAEVDINVGFATGNHLILTLKGSLEVIDSCHQTITKTLVRKLGLRHYRLIDEAGDEIRKQAYPILAKVEQELRAFVNQSILEILGFEWWEVVL